MKQGVLWVLMSLTLLSGCGESKSDRAISGAAVGAGTGLAVGALVGAPGTGALWGGAAGAAVGAMTEPGQINLGKPWWK